MTERLSDERLRSLLSELRGNLTVSGEARHINKLLATMAGAEQAVGELLALRAAGPVMPETPSAAFRNAINDALDRGQGDVSLQIYSYIRAALAKEQACSTQVPPNPAPHTPANAADGAVSREHQGNVP